MPRVRPITLSDNVLNADAIINQEFRFTSILPSINTNELAIEFLASLGLLRNEAICPVCNNNCTMNAYAQGTDGYRWRCNRHNFTKSLRCDSFFEKSHLSLAQITTIMYMWSRDCPQSEIQWEANVNKNTVVDWCTILYIISCLLYTSPSPRDLSTSRMPSSA